MLFVIFSISFECFDSIFGARRLSFRDGSFGFGFSISIFVKFM